MGGHQIEKASLLASVIRAGIPALADTAFEFTRYALNGIVASTLARAEKGIGAAGGAVCPTEVVIPIQALLYAAVGATALD